MDEEIQQLARPALDTQYSFVHFVSLSICHLPFAENDELPMVACDRCFVWQHMECTDYKEEVNSAYLCEQCAPNQHSYLQFGFKTHIEYVKAKKKEPREIQNHQTEQQDHPNANNTTTSTTINNSHGHGHSRRRSTARTLSQNDIDFSFESSSQTSRSNSSNSNSSTTHRKSSLKHNDHQLNGNSSSVKVPKRKQSKQQHRIVSSSDVELMSETEELLDISDAQSEIKLSPHPSSVEVHHINGECIHEDRDKESNFDPITKQHTEVKKPKPKRSRSALAVENMTVEQMLERVRRMAQYVEKFENEHTSRQNINGSVSDEEETSGNTKKKSRETVSSSALPVLITPSPSDHTMTPEPYFVSSPLDCDVTMNSPPTTEHSPEKEGTTLIDQCEELRKRICRFEQTYGDQIQADDEQKIII
ncbi:962_t:CDS:2 [Ambispora gerdemannii]|uniref:962_t:CDS:1 n=1 Tax=Ambispora gerdemannii TaxID=144530 RepID=A0A9N8W474_9GLOM|nr:962_t:CDS:2 [Ambispora gerdemannii]